VIGLTCHPAALTVANNRTEKLPAPQLLSPQALMAVVMMVVMVHRPHMTITPVYDWRPVDRRHVNRSGSIIVRLSGEDAHRRSSYQATE
jgi:hypothetical protein